MLIEFVRRISRPLFVACLLLTATAMLVLAGGDPPVLTGGSSSSGSTSSDAAPAGPTGTMTGAPTGRGTSIMPELPPKMPEEDALAAEERLDGAFAFERLKLLVGEWEGTAGKEAAMSPARVTWEITAGGTALLERQFAGTDHEMMSVYALEGEDLILTHYSVTGSQPRLRFDGGESVANLYTFRFNGGSNLGKNVQYVHAGTIHFVNANQVKAEWVIYAGSRKVGSNRFELKRMPGS